MNRPPGFTEERIPGPDGVHMAVRRWEAPEPEAALLVLHGLGDHGGRYRDLAMDLRDRGVSTVAPDLLGHGRSPGLRGDAPSLEALLDQIRAARDWTRSRSGEVPLFLLGHSLGGLLALRHLQLHGSEPYRGAVLSAPWLRTLTPVPLWKRLLGRVLLRVAPNTPFTVAVSPGILTRDPEKARAWELDPLVHERITPRLFFQVLDAQGEVWDAGVNIPLLILVPGEDELVDATVTLAWARERGADLAVARELPGVRHEPLNDLGREEVFREIHDWMRLRMEGGPSQNPDDEHGYG